MRVNIKNLVHEIQCYGTVRKLCWPAGRVRFVNPLVLSEEISIKKTLLDSVTSAKIV